MTNSKAHVFLASTPLHLLQALAITDVHQLNDAHLLMIDQDSALKTPYFTQLTQWSNNPFASMHQFFRPPRQPLRKWQARQATFRELKHIAKHIRPKAIYGGNDRRIEFQYLMHTASEMNLMPRGIYLDDGLFTYAGRQASFSINDRFIDHAIKKLVYGFWWKHPKTVGASDWITDGYVAFPDLAHPLLQSKHLKPLTAKYWQCPSVTSFCQQLIDQAAAQIDFSQFDAVITLPHESILNQQPRYRDKLIKIIEHWRQQNGTVAIKSHPRNKVLDPLNTADMGATVLSQRLPFEAMLPLLASRVSVYGDLSTTLLITRLLKPEASVYALFSDTNTRMASIYQQLGILVWPCVS